MVLLNCDPYCLERTPATRSPGKRSRSPSVRSPSKRTPGSRSPPGGSSQRDNTGDLLEITVNSVMEGVQEAKVLVPATSKVSELKNVVSDATDVLPEKQILLYKTTELKNDNTLISNYGITEDCQIMMSVKMSTGSKTARSGNAVLYVPPTFPEGSVTDLRNRIRSMTHIQGKSKCKYKIYAKKERYKVDSKHSEWTPQKQIEHELTRNRMKKFLKRRRKKILVESPPASPGSVIDSPVIPASPDLSRESAESIGKKKDPTMITERQLKNFFEPPETLVQLERKMNELTLPPSNLNELGEMKAQREAHLKTLCRVCRRKLHVTEQQMPCACTYLFCKKHRKPDTHFCNIDHRQTGRSKIRKVTY
ncbi:hypothetical protein Aduo_014026 [Ancylostoma duodenale]